MDREFTYTKERLRFILGDILARDIRGTPAYITDDQAEEGFEKRAAIEFLLWFLDQAFPEQFSFACKYERLEDEYPESAARRIAEGRGWAARRVAEHGSTDNVVLVDFRKNKK
jgi:hypothetical protein